MILGIITIIIMVTAVLVINCIDFELFFCTDNLKKINKKTNKNLKKKVERDYWEAMRKINKEAKKGNNQAYIGYLHPKVIEELEQKGFRIDSYNNYYIHWGEK